MSSIEAVQIVRNLANKELEFCNIVDTPYICSAISQPSKKEKIVEEIVEIVGKRGLSISMAISEIETNLNPLYNS